ncbi:MAG: hypothetical protein HKN26_12590 [Acidimicrobiales bacterium]|nr:hypothetical protein [Acidimicrobiales bacterium]
MKRLARALLGIGIAVTILGLSKYHAAEVAVPAYDYTSSSRFAWSGFYGLLLLTTSYGVGLPDLTRRRRNIVAASLIASGGAALAFSFVQLVLGNALLPRFVVFGSATLLVPWFWICANLSNDVRERDSENDRVIVVGSWADAAELETELDSGAERPARIVDVLSPHDLVPRSISDRPLRQAAQAGGATVVVLDREAQSDPVVVPQVAELHEQGVRVRTLALFYEEWLGKLPAAELERVSLLFDIGEIHRRRYARQRRLFDVIVGLVGFGAFALAVPFVWVGNTFGNRGPLLFKQERVGQGGEPFTIYKFRTMTDAGGDTTSWTTENDPRITKFGGFLRLSHLDELPQMLNIVRGDLAFVGPRPEQAHYVEELTEKLPFYRVRHLVKPGLTGWAQVKYGYASDDRDALEKLQYEFYYLRHQGLMFDMRIVVRTLRSVLGRRGR